jgi:hypothetical protein
MDRSIGSRIALVVLTAATMVGAYYLHFFFLVQNCYLGDAGPVPALASTQGRFCGDPDSPLNFVLLGFEAGAVVALILFVSSYRSAKSWMGKVASFMVPVLVMGFTWGLLALPRDTCSQAAKKSEPAYRCATSMT